jgi:hypothetical protein
MPVPRLRVVDVLDVPRRLYRRHFYPVALLTLPSMVDALDCAKTSLPARLRRVPARRVVGVCRGEESHERNHGAVFPATAALFFCVLALLGELNRIGPR